MEVAIILIVIVVLFLAFLIYGQIKWGKKPESEKQSFSEKINEQTQQFLKWKNCLFYTEDQHLIGRFLECANQMQNIF